MRDAHIHPPDAQITSHKAYLIDGLNVEAGGQAVVRNVRSDGRQS